MRADLSFGSISAALGVELIEYLLPSHRVDISAAADDWRRKSIILAPPTRSPRWAGEIAEYKFGLRAKENNLRLARPESGCLTWDWVVVGQMDFHTVQVK